ncbi:MAG: SWIM zinc finger family protein, partial [Trebonia sp.]
MNWREDWYAPSRPIAVEGGVKAKSKRGAIGEQWWSRRFIGVLESFGMSGRLTRGRTYARKGQVIEFSLGTGKVTALVQGSRPAPYKVTIKVLPLTTAQWRDVEARLASQAVFRAKLLAGEMPAEIEEVFAECGTPLFPRSSGDLDMRCSCPDWGVPCKHLAAVCYV